VLSGAFLVGQNIYWSATKLDWKTVLGVWKNENAHFTYGSTSNDFKLVGNYTQVFLAIFNNSADMVVFNFLFGW